MANGASRSADIADWFSKENVTRKVFGRFGVPDIEPRATQSLWKVPKFMSRGNLIGRCTQKIREQEVRGILVAPPPLPATSPMLEDSSKDELEVPSQVGPSHGSGDNLGNRQEPQGLERQAADCLASYWLASGLQEPLSADARRLIESS